MDYRRNDVTPNEIAPLRARINHLERLNMVPGLKPTIGAPIIVPHPTRASQADVMITAMDVDAAA